MTPNNICGVYLFFLIGATLALTASSLPTSGHYEEEDGVERGDLSPGDNNLDWLIASELGHRAQKRRSGLSDPRSLFANIYGNYGSYVGYRKRLNLPSQTETNSYYYGPSSLALASRKRGLGDRYDPRNLFRAIYGYRK